MFNMRGAYYDDDSTVIGSDNLGTTSSSRGMGTTTFAFVWVMALTLGSAVLSVVPIIWPITEIAFFVVIAGWLGLLLPGRGQMIAGYVAVYGFFAFPVLWIASVVRHMGGH